MTESTHTTERSSRGQQVHTYECAECQEVHDCTSRLKRCPDCGGPVKRVDVQAGAWTSSLAHRVEVEGGPRDYA